MDDIFVVFYLAVFGIFWTVGLLLLFSKMAYKRDSEIINGKVYKNERLPFSRYNRTYPLVEVDENGQKMSVSGRKYFGFYEPTYNIGDYISFYRVKKSYGYMYKRINGYYNSVWFCFFFPVLTMLLSLLGYQG